VAAAAPAGADGQAGVGLSGPERRPADLDTQLIVQDLTQRFAGLTGAAAG